jgi:tetratricopeptide (TPR) repeat protein
MFDAPEAEKLLAKAVGLDPSFALGHSALASAWSALGYDERAKTEAQKALNISLNLSPHVRQLIAGQVNESTRNWDQAVTAYRQLLDFDPENVDYAIKLANALTNNSRGQDALLILDQVRRLPDPIGQEAQIDLACSEAAVSLGQFRLSLDYAERAIQRGTELNEKNIVARAGLRKAWATHRLGLEDPMPGLLEARRDFAQSGDQQGVATALRTAAAIQSEHGDASAALNSYEQAIAISERVGDRRSLAMATNGLATLFYNRGELEKAKNFYQQYLALEREVDSKVNTAGALGNIANIEDARGNLHEAIRLNEESIRIFTEAGDQRALATATNNLAILLYELGELDSAAKKFTAAAEIARKIGYQRGVAYDLSGLGDVQRSRGNLDQALSLYREALGIRNQLGEKHNAAVSRLSLALINLDKGTPAGAEDSVAEIAEEFQKDRSESDEASAREIQARIFIAQHKIAQARAALNRAHLLAKASPGLPLELDIALTSIRLDLTTHHNIASLSSEISRLLVTVQKSGYREYSYKVGLLGAEFDIAHGRVQQGRSQIKLIAQDSQANGFGLIAQKANHRLQELDQ